MKLVFYSITLNHHQAPVADFFYSLLGENYRFIETSNVAEKKGGVDDYSSRPYLLKAWENKQQYEQAMNLSKIADVCVFGGNESLPFLKERMKLNLLSFCVAERWLKRGWINIFSPKLLLFLKEYYFGKWYNKKLYKLCASAYASSDDYKLGIFRNRCFKWGYFTQLRDLHPTHSAKDHFTIMWCARFLDWKHPELPIKLAKNLKEAGYNFVINMYGEGIEKPQTISLSQKLCVQDVVNFKGNVPNNQIIEAMCEHDVFLFTSDRNEGWGAVLNEAMSCSCIPIASNEIGSVPYLLKNNENGVIFKSCDLDDLTSKVKSLFENVSLREKIYASTRRSLEKLWSPQVAVNHFMQLISDIENNREPSIKEGPCSRA